MPKDRYRHTVTTTVTHQFYTHGPLPEDVVRDLEFWVEQNPTSTEPILDCLPDLTEYDSDHGIVTDYGEPRVMSLQVGRAGDGTLMQTLGDDDAEVSD
jgi:hypothetical protein